VCPRDLLPLAAGENELSCAAGHTYSVLRGVPVLLLDDVEPTQAGYWALGEEWGFDLAEQQVSRDGAIHPYVRNVLGGTCGNLYDGLDMKVYPIPELRLPPGRGRFLEIGSNWGRWCVAATRLGYAAVGVDPSLGAVLAARQVASELDADADFLVGDGRHLPFEDGTFDVVFSYSVFQHFARDDARAALREAVRVLAPGGTLLVQMPNRYGFWNLLQQARRGFRDASAFGVRYWSPRQLLDAVEHARLEVDGYFSLNAQASDIPLLRRRHRIVVRTSEALRLAARALPPLRYVADSLYLRARKPRDP